jgi:hypothetical protein
MKRCWSLVLVAGTALPALAQIQGQTDARRAYEAELISNAAARASFLQDAPSPAAGWAKGKFFMTDGGANTLNVGGFSQTRYLAVFRDNQPDDTNDFTHGFQQRRTRINASGSVWDKNFTFKVEGEFGRNNGVLVLTDAFGRYAWDNGTWLRWGQFKAPLWREDNVSDTLQLTVERSAVTYAFGQNRSQGVEFGWADKQLRFMGAFTDGLNTLNTDFNGPEADFALTGRGEFMFAGEDFKRFDDNTSWRESDYAGMVGAALHWQTGGETGGTADADIFQATADVSVEGAGWNAFAAVVWRSTDVGGGGSTDDLGFLLQGGIFLTEQLELFARYDLIAPDVGDDFSTATAGVNYYISPKSHAVKFTGDIVWYFDPVSDTPILSPSTGMPLLADAEGDQLALRMQLQLIY